jgi:hypothetical protein
MKPQTVGGIAGSSMEDTKNKLIAYHEVDMQLWVQY